MATRLKDEDRTYLSRKTRIRVPANAPKPFNPNVALKHLENVRIDPDALRQQLTGLANVNRYRRTIRYTDLQKPANDSMFADELPKLKGTIEDAVWALVSLNTQRTRHGKGPLIDGQNFFLVPKEDGTMGLALKFKPGNDVLEGELFCVSFNQGAWFGEHDRIFYFA